MATHFLDRLGTNDDLATACGVSKNAVSNWRSPDRQIPWQHRFVLAEIAKKKKVALPDGFFGEAA